MVDIEKVIETRGSTHGRFEDNAKYSQLMKRVITAAVADRGRRGADNLSHVQREALDMIVHKIARILAGDADYSDHWVDIQGYAQLVLDNVEEGDLVDKIAGVSKEINDAILG